MHAGIWRLKWSNIKTRQSKHDLYERIISRCSYATQDSGCGWLQNWLETTCRAFTPCYLLVYVPQGSMRNVCVIMVAGPRAPPGAATIRVPSLFRQLLLLELPWMSYTDV
jgi:hypothetical protein